MSLSTRQVLELLERNDFFGLFTPADLRQLAASMQPRILAPGEVVASQGESGCGGSAYMEAVAVATQCLSQGGSGDRRGGVRRGGFKGLSGYCGLSECCGFVVPFPRLCEVIY